MGLCDYVCISWDDTMQLIKLTILEVQGIFQQLAHMVKEQEKVMVRIDSNVEDTAMNVEMGHAEILKHCRSDTSSLSSSWFVINLLLVQSSQLNQCSDLCFKNIFI